MAIKKIDRHSFQLAQSIFLTSGTENETSCKSAALLFTITRFSVVIHCILPENMLF